MTREEREDASTETSVEYTTREATVNCDTFYYYHDYGARMKMSIWRI